MPTSLSLETISSAPMRFSAIKAIASYTVASGVIDHTSSLFVLRMDPIVSSTEFSLLAQRARPRSEVRRACHQMARNARGGIALTPHRPALLLCELACRRKHAHVH